MNFNCAVEEGRTHFNLISFSFIQSSQTSSWRLHVKCDYYDSFCYKGSYSRSH